MPDPQTEPTTPTGDDAESESPVEDTPNEASREDDRNP